ncbi:MAG: 4-hydroxythreonine-4-phosphate dehydrogenase PdxA [Vampirovibrionales bacterium]|nr:4-hydroxythreonine-4-phosphate dehydrogenase PdxA [Vampirovibrionales bacterium]
MVAQVQLESTSVRASAQKPVIALTPGDITGIGPEITVKLLARPELWAPVCDLKIFGCKQTLQAQAQALGLKLPDSGWHIVDIQDAIKAASPDARVGLISWHALEQAVAAIAAGEAHGLLTGPISKRRLVQANCPITSGHTEILAHFAKVHWPLQPCIPDMAFVYERFCVLLLTRHVPLMQVRAVLTPQLVVSALDKLVAYLLANQPKQDGRALRVAVLGVNPHAEEIGGDEERDVLLPALAQLRSAYPNVTFTDPLPADAAFRGLDPMRPPYNAYVAAYHDQGLIPMKLLAGLKATQITLGLPFWRSSVSHGTAEDIAGKGVADSASLSCALKVLLGLIGR